MQGPPLHCFGPFFAPVPHKARRIQAVCEAQTYVRLPCVVHAGLRDQPPKTASQRNEVIQRDLKVEILDASVSRLSTGMFEHADRSDFGHLRNLVPYHACPPDWKPYPLELADVKELDEGAVQAPG